MRGLGMIKKAGVLVLILFGCSVFFFGCGSCYQPSILHHPTKPFPAKVPDNALLTVNLNEKGQFFIADQSGEAVSTKPVPFSALIETADVQDQNWLKILGRYTLYKIKGGNHLWLCGQDYQCGVGRLDGENDTAIFSVNFDGKGVFVGDAQGQAITMKDMTSFVSLVEETDFGEKIGLETLSVFNVYEIKGSIRFVTCSANNICYCACYNPATRRSTACVNGKCN